MNQRTYALYFLILLSTTGARAQPASQAGSMSCEELAVAIAEEVGGTMSQLGESQRLTMKDAPAATAGDAIKQQALGVALNAIPGQAGALAAQAVGMAENAAEARKDAQRQRDNVKSAQLDEAADQGLSRLETLFSEQEHRCEP